MIYVPTILKQVNPGIDDHLYSYHDNFDADEKSAYDAVKQQLKSQERIFLEDSLFSNLNYGKVTNALRKKNMDQRLEQSYNKGILLNAEQFDGRIEFIQNHISDNMVFIPGAIAANNDKYNKTSYDPNKLIGFELD